MRHTNKILFKLMLVVLTLASCNKYLDVNTDPNRVTDANITPELLFTQAENGVGNRMASGNFLFLNHWVGYSAQNGTFAPQQNEITYNIDFSFSNPIFVNHMDVLFDLHQAEVKAIANGDIGVQAGSMVLAAKLWQELVDLYGNIPYTQTFNATVYPRPAYDKGQDIYNALQLKLDSAIDIFGGDLSSAFATADIIAHGDAALWIKFANTLKLRLLIRQSEVAGFDPAPEITKIYAKGGPLGAGETIGVNPGYVNDVNKQNPFYSNFGWSPTGVVATSSDNANAYIVTAFQNDADPRLERVFYPVGFTGNAFAGAVYGDDISNIPPSSGLSYFGPGIVGGINTAHAGDGTGAVQTQWIMPSFESMFYVAEAAARGWIADDPTTAYEAAVTESFVWLGVPDAETEATDYIAGNTDADYATFITTPEGSTTKAKAQFIAYQKYLAMANVDQLEAYSDIRRLDMLTDKSYISLAYGGTSLPLRLLYPQSEYTTNFDNVSAEGDINQFTSKLFWEP